MDDLSFKQKKKPSKAQADIEKNINYQPFLIQEMLQDDADNRKMIDEIANIKAAYSVSKKY